ncbi:hypothetical protein SHIRM173S_13232 [Streptomyces hirsutus]
MRRAPRNRTAVGCTLLVIALGAGFTGCSSGGNPLSAEPYDAADRISFNGPSEGKKADPDTPLEIVAEDSGGRITDVTTVDAAGHHVGGDSPPTAAAAHSPLAADTDYTVRVSTEDEDGAPGCELHASPRASPPPQEQRRQASASPSARERAPTASAGGRHRARSRPRGEGPPAPPAGLSRRTGPTVCPAGQVGGGRRHLELG